MLTGDQYPARGDRSAFRPCRRAPRRRSVRRSSSVRSCRASWKRPARSSPASPTTGGSTSSPSRCSGLLSKVHAVTGNWGVAIILVTVPAEAAVLSAVGDQRPLDGEDEGARAAHQEPPGDLQGRPREARQGDDGAVQAREGQPGLRLSAHDHPDRRCSSPSTGCCSRAWRCARRPSWAGSTTCPRAIPTSSCRPSWPRRCSCSTSSIPSAGDPTQQKIMMFVPLVMSVTFAFFPVGLVLYWVTNTLLGIAQQWNINRRIVETPQKRAPQASAVPAERLRRKRIVRAPRARRLESRLQDESHRYHRGCGNPARPRRDRSRAHLGAKAPEIAAVLVGELPLPRHATFARFLDAQREPIDAGLAIFFPGAPLLHRRARAGTARSRRPAGARGARGRARWSSGRVARCPVNSPNAHSSTTSSTSPRPRPSPT